MVIAIPMYQVKTIMKTGGFMPNRPPIDHLIAGYIADKLGDTLDPNGFALGSELALEHLLTGKSFHDAFTRQRVYELADSGGYRRFGDLVIAIVEGSYCPPDFISGVRDYYRGLTAHLAETQEKNKN